VVRRFPLGFVAVAQWGAIPYHAIDMARRKPKKEQGNAAAPPVPAEPTARTSATYLAALLATAVICFFPLFKYFFAQDDFTLLLTAYREGWGAFADYFAQRPGMFRPLTKAAYFGSMYRVFGLDAAPYHAVSIAVHLLNTVLLYRLMNKVRVSRTAALVSVTLFALSIAFYHIVGWISCIQQLLGLCFMLLSLIWGIDYLHRRSSRTRWLSLGSYVLALMSVEQTFAAPVVLVLFAWLSPGAPEQRLGLKAAAGRYAAHLAILVLYLVFIGVWKTPPDQGSYVFSFGRNVTVNLLSYLGWTLEFGAALPSRMATGNIPWSLSHVFVFLIVAYHLARNRWREVAFGLSFFVLGVFPALFLSDHTFYLHTYIPAFGLLYLMALFVDDLLELPWMRTDTSRLALLGVVLVTMTAVSFVMVRKNERYRMFDLIDMPRSFVLRRALIAGAMYESLSREKPFEDSTEKVYLVYGREGGRDEAKWNNKNVKAATGWGAMVNLMYDKPDLQVEFKVAGDAIGWEEQFVSDIYFYDDYGNCSPMPLQSQE